MTVHTVRIETLVQPLDSGRAGGPSAEAIGYNAVIIDSTRWDDIPGQIPVLGDLGLCVLESFESILDYVHHRLILIRVDRAGRRLAQVPGYTPLLTVPLVPLDQWWGIAGLINNVPDTLMIDTGSDDNSLTSTKQRADRDFSTRGTKTLIFAGRHFPMVNFKRSEMEMDMLGASFLQQQGIVGFNFRTKQFILYQRAD